MGCLRSALLILLLAGQRAIEFLNSANRGERHLEGFHFFKHVLCGLGPCFAFVCVVVKGCQETMLGIYGTDVSVSIWQRGVGWKALWQTGPSLAPAPCKRQSFLWVVSFRVQVSVETAAELRPKPRHSTIAFLSNIGDVMLSMQMLRISGAGQALERGCHRGVRGWK